MKSTCMYARQDKAYTQIMFLMRRVLRRCPRGICCYLTLQCHLQYPQDSSNRPDIWVGLQYRWGRMSHLDKFYNRHQLLHCGSLSIYQGYIYTANYAMFQLGNRHQGYSFLGIQCPWDNNSPQDSWYKLRMMSALSLGYKYQRGMEFKLIYNRPYHRDSSRNPRDIENK